MKITNPNGRGTIRTLFLFGLLTGCLFPPVSSHAAEPKVKVHKHLITVTPPDQSGVTRITGQAGAIETTSAVRVQLIDLETKSKQPLTVKADGSFTASISIKSGHKIRILARNAEKKRSQGTFTIPSLSVPDTAPETLTVPVTLRRSPELVPALNVESGLAMPLPIDSAGAMQHDADEVPVAVFINVVDMRTGHLLAYERVEGTIKKDRSNRHPDPRTLASFLKNCVSILKVELGKLAENPEKPETALSVPGSSHDSNIKDKPAARASQNRRNIKTEIRQAPNKAPATAASETGSKKSD
jgi:hypothetical protein